MSVNAANTYDIAPYVAELYDHLEQTTADVELIRGLVPAGARLQILEPFCGSARIAAALAGDGHQVVGIDQSACMLARARERLDRSPPAVRERVTLLEADAVTRAWPGDFDLV